MLLVSVAKKLFRIFSPTQRRQAVGLFFAMWVAAGLEALGIGLVMPFIQLINDASGTGDGTLLTRFPDWVQSLAPVRVMLLACGGLVAFFAVKSLLIILTYYAQYRFAARGQVEGSVRLLSSYLNQSYEFFVEQNTSEAIRNINEEVKNVYGIVFPNIFVAWIELFTLLIIVAMVMWLAPVVSLVSFLFLSLVAAGFYIALRRRLTVAGLRQQRSHGQMLRYVIEAFRGIKQLKVYGVETYFVNRYRDASDGYARAMQLHRTIKIMPARLLEVIGIAAVCSIVIGTIVAGNVNASKLMPTLALLGFALVRVLPSLNRIVGALTTLRHYVPSIDVVQETLNSTANVSEKHCVQPVATLGGGGTVTFDDVAFQYRGSDAWVLRDVSFHVDSGDKVGIVGESGAGKTTLVDLILGVLDPTRGKVGISASSDSTHVFSYVPQNVNLVDGSLIDNVALGIPAEEIDEALIWDCLHAACLDTFVRDHPQALRMRVGEDGVALSGGQRQRIGIARALYYDRPIFVMDEGTSALDLETERILMSRLNAALTGRTVFLIAHRLSTLRDVDYMLRVNSDASVEKAANESNRKSL